MAKAKIVYWDSCAWLGLINGEADKKRALGLIFRGAERGHYEIWTSSASLVEVSRHADEADVAKPLDPAKLQVLDDLFRQPFVKVLPFDLEAGILARRLYRETPGLGKRWDAAHLAAAIRANVETLHTYDREDLLHLSGKLNCRNGNPLIICYPDETTDGELFAKDAHDKAQAKRFIDAAREAECSEDEAEIRENMKRIAPVKQAKGQKSNA